MNINLRFRSSPLDLLLSDLFDFLFHYLRVFVLMISSNEVWIRLYCNTSTAYIIQYVVNTVKSIVMSAVADSKVAVKSTSHHHCILRVWGAHIMTVIYSNAASTVASIPASFAFWAFLLLSTYYSRVWGHIAFICTLIVVGLVHFGESKKITNGVLQRMGSTLELILMLLLNEVLNLLLLKIVSLLSVCH